MHITTYGGGETLFHVFNAIAMLMNGQTGTLFQPLMLIGGMIGAVWAIGKAFWESSVDGLVTKWFIPMVVLLGVCMIPSETVHIYDPILGAHWHKHVDHVPLGLARSAMVISSIGSGLTTAIEQVFAVPGHPQYSKVGMIFGAENALDMAHYAISDENLAASMRDFVENCIVYDIAHGYYSLDEFKRSPNIWELVKNNTSQVRMFNYCEKDARKRCQLLSCRVGATKLETLLKAHNRALEKHHVVQYLPFFYTGLTGIAASKQDLISQQVMMQAFNDGVERKCDENGVGANFAIRRAYMQQRHTYEAVGGLAAKALVVLRNVFEALIYASFIFIMPFSLMPLGFRIFLKWLWLLIWIQLWPPFYAILNSGIMSAAQHTAHKIVGIEQGLTYFTSVGLHNLAMDTQAYAAYASLTVPFISYALLQGGISSFVHLASSITGVSQGAGSAAAQEQATGNYSFGNVQLGNYSAFNESMLQNQLSPSLSIGAYQENRGTSSTIYGEDGRMLINEPQSQLPFDINMAQSLSAGLNRSAESSLGFAEQEKQSYTQSTMATNRHLSEWMEHLGQNKSYSDSIAQGTQHKEATVFQESLSVVQSFAKKHGMSTADACELMLNISAGMSLPVLSASAGLSNRTMAAKNDILEDARSVCASTNFSKNYETLVNTAQDERFNSQDEKGLRLSQHVADSYETSQSHQKQMEKHLQKAASLKETAHYVDQNTISINYKLNNKFVDYVAHERMANGEIRGNKKAETLIRHFPQETAVLAARFMAQEQKEIMANLPFGTQKGFKAAQDTLVQRDITVENPIQSSPRKVLKMDSGVDFDAKQDMLERGYHDQGQRITQRHDQGHDSLEKTYLENGAKVKAVTQRSPQAHIIKRHIFRENTFDSERENSHKEVVTQVPMQDKGTEALIHETGQMLNITQYHKPVSPSKKGIKP